MMRTLAMALAIAAVLGPGTAAAETPRTIIYEGTLRAADGDPVAGIYWMRFSLRRSRNAAAELWSEQSYVAVDEGRFLVELGKRNAIPPDLELTDLWLIVVNDGITLIRARLDAAWISGGLAGGRGGGGDCRKAAVADNATRFSGLDLDQLKAILARSIGPGGKRRLTRPVGNTDGESFTLECPPGHMLTGLEGTTGDGLRSLRLICRPMEAR